MADPCTLTLGGCSGGRGVCGRAGPGLAAVCGLHRQHHLAHHPGGSGLCLLRALLGPHDLLLLPVCPNGAPSQLFPPSGPLADYLPHTLGTIMLDTCNSVFTPRALLWVGLSLFFLPEVLAPDDAAGPS